MEGLGPTMRKQEIPGTETKINAAGSIKLTPQKEVFSTHAQGNNESACRFKIEEVVQRRKQSEKRRRHLLHEQVQV